MSIVLEGPDNSGKTTLANALRSAVHDCKYVHAGGPPRDLKAEIDCMVEQHELVALHWNVVLDRCTSISQSVYNPSVELEPTRRAFRERLYSTKSALIVYCRPSTEWLLRTNDLTWREDEPDELKRKIVEGQHEFVERYDKIMRDVPHLTYNFQERTHTYLAEQLAAALRFDFDAVDRLFKIMEVAR